jgi:hypothetical protein
MISLDDYINRPYFPISYLHGFLEFLNRNNNKIKIITYKDLDWISADGSVESYRNEFLNWMNNIKNGSYDPQLIYVLLQHDIDARPDRAKILLESELKNNIPSNIMIFNKRINRKYLENNEKLEYTEYNIDHKFLQGLERSSGFVIGYHSNAMERALYDKKLAADIFHQDVIELRKHHLIEYYSPHGGVRGHNGLNNLDVFPPKNLLTPPRWIHNGRSPSFKGYFSDGGINSEKIDPNTRDLRKFVRTWKPGNRYRVVIHPQYYGENVEKSPRLQNTQWYENILAMHKTNDDADIWGNMILKC